MVLRFSRRRKAFQTLSYCIWCQNSRFDWEKRTAPKQSLRFFTDFTECCWWKTICQISHLRVCCSLHSSAWTFTLKRSKEQRPFDLAPSGFLDLRKPENYILLSKCKAVDQTPVKLIDFGNLVSEIIGDQCQLQHDWIVLSPVHAGKNGGIGWFGSRKQDQTH